jgi:hypothetical protein
MVSCDGPEQGVCRLAQSQAFLLLLVHKDTVRYYMGDGSQDLGMAAQSRL